MNKEKFKKLYTEMRAKEQDLLGVKRHEYTQGDDDVLLNFKQSAAFIGCDPKDVCIAYLMKHVQSVVLAVKKDRDLKFVWENPDGTEGLAQRFCDARNYLVLLAGLIEDQKSTSKDQSLNDSIQKIFKYIGERPKMGAPVWLLNDGTVSVLTEDFQHMIGCRMPTNQVLGVDKIMVEIFGVVDSSDYKHHGDLGL